MMQSSDLIRQFTEQPLIRELSADAAQAVLNTLLDKSADAGVQEIESIQVLKLKPFDSMGTLPEIIKSGFGDRNGYNQAISELESEIYHLPPRSA